MKPEPGSATACELQSQLCRPDHHTASGGKHHDSDPAVSRPHHRESDRDTPCERCSIARRAAPVGKPAPSSTNRLPWRALGLGSSAIGGIAAAYYSHPVVGLAIIICGACVAAVTIITALFGSATTSDRAFRLLRWFTNRPEPKAPLSLSPGLPKGPTVVSAAIDLSANWPRERLARTPTYGSAASSGRTAEAGVRLTCLKGQQRYRPLVGAKWGAIVGRHQTTWRL
jgi:hypothetical protein